MDNIPSFCEEKYVLIFMPLMYLGNWFCLHQGGFCYGFVEFKESTSVQAALQVFSHYQKQLIISVVGLNILS